jgi:hypothetical protein
MDHKKRFWVWAVITVVLIVFALCLVFWKVSAPKKTASVVTVVSNVPAGQLPAGFPVNIPMEQGAPVVSNFNAATQSGQFESARAFQSSKTASQNIALYAEFLTNPANGLTMISSSTNPAGGNIMVAENSGGVLTIEVSPLPPQPMPASLVKIIYTTNPPR